MANEIEKNNGEIIIYQSEDGKIRLDVRLEDKTVWLTQEQIAQLYGKGERERVAKLLEWPRPRLSERQASSLAIGRA